MSLAVKIQLNINQRYLPDWKVWILRGGDFENLIVNIWRASKVRGGFLPRAIQTFHTGLSGVGEIMSNICGNMNMDVAPY